MPPPAKAAAANTIRLISFFMVAAPPNVGKRFIRSTLGLFQIDPSIEKSGASVYGG
jgi:hypothetical protein